MDDKPSVDLINRIRNQLIENVEKKSHLYDENDAKELRNNNWLIERYVIYHNNEEKAALKGIDERLLWKKSFGVTELCETYFPLEFYQIGAMLPYKVDKNGNRVILIRLKAYRKMAELERILKQFFIYIVEQIDRQTQNQGWVVIVDAKGARMANMDIDLCWFIIKALVNYYPRGYKYLLCYEMPWIFEPIWKTIRGWLREDERHAIRFVKKEQIFEYVEPENLPIHMGGKSEDHLSTSPANVMPASKLPHLGLNQKQLESFAQLFAKIQKDLES